MTAAGSPLLTLTNLDVSYGPLPAVRGLSLRVEQGQIVALLGANGAGKTTTLRAVAGILRPVRPAITFDGRPLAGVYPERRVRLGMATVPEGRDLFQTLSVDENLRAGAYTRRDRKGIDADRERIYGYFPDLAERRKMPAGALSGGQAQMLAIGRALMAAPRLLLLDEPSHGLAPRLIDRIFSVLGEVNRTQGMAMLLVEQRASWALQMASYGYVLEHGALALEGPAADLRNSRLVQALYLGDDSSARQP